jgi:hypothetical protein
MKVKTMSRMGNIIRLVEAFRKEVEQAETLPTFEKAMAKGLRLPFYAVDWSKVSEAEKAAIQQRREARRGRPSLPTDRPCLGYWQNPGDQPLSTQEDEDGL